MKVSVVVPARDEAENLESLLPRLLDVLSAHYGKAGHEVIVVDDNSRDGTGSVARRFAQEGPVRALRREGEPGFGQALKVGLAAARGEVVVPFMADGSDDPEDIPDLVAAVDAGADVAYGSRFVKGGRVEGYPRLKLLYNRVYNRLLGLAFALPHRDITNAFKAYRREVLKAVGLDDLAARDFDLTAELPVKAHLAGFSSVEVPVSWRDRSAGESKLKATRKGVVYGWRLLSLFLLGAFLGAEGFRVRERNPRRTALKAGLTGAAGVLAVLALLLLGDVATVLFRLRTLDLLLVLGAGLVYVGGFLFRTWRWQAFLEAAGHPVPPGPVLSSTFLGWLTNLVTPGRLGDVASCVALRSTDEVSLGAGLGTLVLTRLLDLGLLVALLVLGLLLLPGFGLLGSLLAVAVAVTAVIAVGIVLLTRYADRLAPRLARLVPGSDRVVGDMGAAIGAVLRSPRTLGAGAGLSVPVWALEVATFFLVVRSLAVAVPAAETVIAAAAAFASQAFPLTPGGVGTYEAVITGALTLFGAPYEAALSVALLDRVLRALVVVAAGLLGLFHVVVRARNRVVSRRAADRRAALRPTREAEPE